MTSKLITLLSSGVLAMTMSSAYADGDQDKKPEQPQAGVVLISNTGDPYPAEMPTGSEAHPGTPAIVAEGDEKADEKKADLVADGHEKADEKKADLIAA